MTKIAITSAPSISSTMTAIIMAHPERCVVPFGFDSVNLFGHAAIWSLRGSQRAGQCSTRGCTQDAPVEILGAAIGIISGFRLTREARTCASHFWENADYVMWWR